MQALRVRVTGRVQGVGFRAFVLGAARRAGVSGWVQNERDGSVTAFVAGEDAATRAVVEAMRQGPPGAVVDELSVEPAGAAGAAGAFEIR